MLLIEPSPARRHRLAAALRDAGHTVVAVGNLAEIERWPSGEIVVTEGSRFTPWWKHVGASHVIVLASTPAEGQDACRRGASAWVPRTVGPAGLLAMLTAFGELPDTSKATLRRAVAQ